ncbi:GL15852 [Drosophila persimilis]|uniref:GL15852 n=1 Tax=Drosophila persimilis TaxID=7234 RepID=B4H0Y0_DROPE|nr:GL15852 [Drosophila persimilis]
MDQEQLMNAVNPLFSKCQNASSTGILEIDIEQPIESDNLALVDLRYNTLKPEFLRKLMKIQTTFRLVLNDAEVNDNDYEDYDDQDDDDDDDGFIKN